MTRFRLLELHVRILFRFRETFCESTFILLREDTEKVREREEREIQKENKSRQKERMKEEDKRVKKGLTEEEEKGERGEKREGEKNRNALSE